VYILFAFRSLIVKVDVFDCVVAHTDRSRKFSTRAECTWKRVPARASYGSSLLSAVENISAGNMADSSLRFFSFFVLIFPNRGFRRETLHSVHTDNA